MVFRQLINQAKTIKLNKFDRVVITIYIVLILGYIGAGAMTTLTLGGLILIGGAFLVYKGKIFLSIVWYLLADLCWITNAYLIGDFQGVIFVTFGVLFSMLASIKMKNGHMESELAHKDIHKG